MWSGPAVTGMEGCSQAHARTMAIGEYKEHARVEGEGVSRWHARRHAEGVDYRPAVLGRRLLGASRGGGALCAVAAARPRHLLAQVRAVSRKHAVQRARDELLRVVRAPASSEARVRVGSFGYKRVRTMAMGASRGCTRAIDDARARKGDGRDGYRYVRSALRGRTMQCAWRAWQWR